MAIVAIIKFTDAELREQFERSGGEQRHGMPIDKALSNEAVRYALWAALRGERRRAARQAQWSAIQFQAKEDPQ